MKPIFYLKQAILTLSLLLISMQGICQCTAPPNLASTNVAANHAVVSWSSVSNAIKYEYSVKDTSSATPGAGGVATTNNTVLLQGLSAFHCYNFWLRSVCGVGDTSQWEMIRVCTEDTCLVPNPTFTNITASSVTVSWSSLGQAILHYEYALDTNGGSAPNMMVTNNTSVQLTNLKPNTTYYFILRVYCTSGSSSWKTFSFTTTDLDVQNTYTSNSFGITAYPNPASTIINIKLYGARKDAQVFITDLAGKTLLQETVTSNEMKIDISNLPKGMYILKYISGNQQQSVKLVKE